MTPPIRFVRAADGTQLAYTMYGDGPLFTQHHRLLRYDERGCGAFVGDLEAVIDAAGLDEFALLGISQGGPVAIEYSVRYPERVTKP
jgi:pimeloyl-ACP methyl ester carboxylesterase